MSLTPVRHLYTVTTVHLNSNIAHAQHMAQQSVGGTAAFRKRLVLLIEL